MVKDRIHNWICVSCGKTIPKEEDEEYFAPGILWMVCEDCNRYEQIIRGSYSDHVL